MDRRNFLRSTGIAAGAYMLNESLIMAFEKKGSLNITSHYLYPNYSLSEIYFSMAGSYFTIHPVNTDNKTRLQINTCRKVAFSRKDDKHWAHDYYLLSLTKNNAEITFETIAYPWGIEIKAEGVSGRIAFIDTTTLLIDITGAGILLSPMQHYGWSYFTAEGEFKAMIGPAETVHQFRTTPQNKIILVKNPDTKNPEIPHLISVSGNEKNSIAIREGRVESEWSGDLPAIEQAWNKRKEEVEKWMSAMPAVNSEFSNGAKLAWFILWNCQVAPAGRYTHQAILMTKNWMNQVWAWDNCFNALGLASSQPELAWGQVMLLLDNQLPTGQLPDAINDLQIHTGFVKPPVYGWAIRKLIDTTGIEFSKPFLKEAYPKLVKLTEWWYKFRDVNKNGLCAYLHGNDSGWDNSTMFDQGFPTEGSDLAAHLILHTEALSHFAEILALGPDEVNKWKTISEKQLKVMLEKCVQNNRFISPLEATGKAEPTQSLLNYIPMVLGKRLPAEIRNAMVKDLSPGGSYLTEYGLATEPPASPKYDADGYWRGPVWAPSTYLIFDGLIHSGETTLAKEIALRYCRMCEKEPGMWENYNATTGKGLRAPGYTWTAAVFIVMANWLNTQK